MTSLLMVEIVNTSFKFFNERTTPKDCFLDTFSYRLPLVIGYVLYVSQRTQVYLILQDGTSECPNSSEDEKQLVKLPWRVWRNSFRSEQALEQVAKCLEKFERAFRHVEQRELISVFDNISELLKYVMSPKP